MQARAAGKKVVTADFRVIHHHSLELISEVGGWIEAHMHARREVGASRSPAPGRRGRLEAAGAPRRGRARPRHACARRRGAASATPSPTHCERELEEVKRSTSWRLTAPLRALRSAPQPPAARRDGSA